MKRFLFLSVLSALAGLLVPALSQTVMEFPERKAHNKPEAEALASAKKGYGHTQALLTPWHDSRIASEMGVQQPEQAGVIARTASLASDAATGYTYTGFNIEDGMVNFNLDPFESEIIGWDTGFSQQAYVIDNRLNCISYTYDQASGTYPTITKSVYDANTLALVDDVTADVPHSGAMDYVPYILSYDDCRDVVYSVSIANVREDTQSGTLYYLNIFDPDACVLRRIGYLGKYMSSLDDKDQYNIKALCCGYGTLYALLVSDAVYLATIDPVTCKTEIIGRTGIPTQYIYGLQPMIYNLQEGTLLANSYNLNDGTVYYKLSVWAQNDGTVKTTEVEKLPTGYTFFYQRPETKYSYYSSYLADVPEFSVQANSDTEISFRVTVPDKLSDCSAIEYPSWVQDLQKSVKIDVYVDNSQVTVNGLPTTIRPGDTVSGTIRLSGQYVEISPGLHTVTAAITPNYNEISPVRASQTLVIGSDAPASPSDATLRITDNEAVIAWSAPTESRYADFGSTIDLSAISYTVVRDTDGKTVASGITDTSCKDIIESDEFTGYTYTVYALHDGQSSRGATTPKVFAGKYVTLPYTNGFSSGDCLEGWEIYSLDNNGTARTWNYNWYQKLLTSSFGMNDDWIVTPPFKMEQGKVYEVQMTVIGKGTLFVTYGDDYDAESQSNVLATLTKTDGTETMFFYIYAEEDNICRIGLHNYNGDSDSYYWNLTQLSVKEASAAKAPATVTGAAFSPDAAGSISGSVKAVMPTLTVDGSSLSGLEAFVVYNAEGRELGRATGVAAGKEASVSISCQDGWNTLKLVAVNSAGEGWPAVVKTFAGYDLASPVSDLKAVWGDSDNKVVLSWSAPTEGVNGGSINSGTLTYKVYQYMLDSGNRYELTETSDREIEIEILDVAKQDQYAMSVTAVTSEGESEYSNVGIVLGTPYVLPFDEPFSEDGIYHSPYILQPVINGQNWAIDTDVYNDNIHPQNDDGVQLVFVNLGAGEGSGRFISPIIDFTDTENPVFSLWLHHSDGIDGSTYAVIDAQTDGSASFTPVADPVTLTGGNGWQRHVFDLSSLKGHKGRVGLTAYAANGKDRVFADNFSIREATGNDLAITGISATRYEKPGDVADINVTVANIGAGKASGFTVFFNADNETIAEQTVQDELGIGEERVLTFQLPLTAGADGYLTYFAELIYDDDDAANNISQKQTVALSQAQLPTPQNLTADDDMNLAWDAPVIQQGHTVTLDFEDVPVFLTDDIAGWNTYDGDGHLTTTFVQYYGNMWPYSNQPLAWMTWSTKDAGCPDAGIWQAYEGERCLIAWANYGVDAEGRANTDEPEDDWFISPEILGGSEFSFMTAANDASCRLEVAVSSTDRAPESFTRTVETVDYTTTAQWKEISCTLPDDAKYVALHVTVNGFGILVDNISYTDCRTPKLQGYNVYRGAEVVNFTEATNAQGSTTGRYGVSALYDMGESSLSNVVGQTGVETISTEAASAKVESGAGFIRIYDAAGENVTVASVSGIVYYNAPVSDSVTVELPAGVYAVRVGGKTAKAMVR